MNFTNLRTGLINIDSLSICPICNGIRGTWRPVTRPGGRPCVQLCECDRGARPRQQRKWPGFDFNQITELCRCCGLELLPSGSKFSVWFCEDCKSRVRRLHSRFNSYVVPIGRHSLMGDFGVDLNRSTPPDSEALRRFLSKWNGVVDVMISLGAWTRTIVGDNLVQFGFGPGPTDVSLTEYADRAADNFDRKPQHFEEMCEYLGIGGNYC